MVCKLHYLSREYNGCQGLGEEKWGDAGQGVQSFSDAGGVIPGESTVQQGDYS